MSDATLQPTPPGTLPIGVERKDASVNTTDLEPQLMAFLAALGRMHLNLFGKVLVVTSANDGQHAKNSLHYKNRAVDLRATDLTDPQVLLFAGILVSLAPVWKMGVFYELTPPGVYHFHVELPE